MSENGDKRITQNCQDPGGVNCNGEMNAFFNGLFVFRMPNHIEYDPGVPTFKHSDKFEARAMVKMMQKEATLAERAWEERTSQRDNNKGFRKLFPSHF